MKYAWADAYCLAKKGVAKEYKEKWDATLYKVGGKMFVMAGGDHDGKPILTIKLDPSYGSFLRQSFRDVVPGYYMNKEHWNSLYLEGCVPDDTVKEMLDSSYEIVLHSFSRKKQVEILK